MRLCRLTAALLAAPLVFCAPAYAQAQVDYATQIKPIFAERCYACHGALRQQASLRLDTAASMHAGGDSGPAVNAHDSAGSLLIAKLRGDDGARMPPDGEGTALTSEQIALVAAWIDQGAPAPADEKPQADPRRHWSFTPPVRPAVPQVASADWVRNPIDAFIAQEHQKRGLTPLGPADRQPLLRRVHLDLVGLPPTRDELARFLADTSPDAYERVVEQLLSSPRYGERWGRHWMDVWRYSDWYGNRVIGSHRNSMRNIWRWRDWIIQSINADKGYDRMIVEMVAGDELAPADDDLRRATGYLGRNFYIYNREVWLHETIEYLGMAMLGLTFKCARCHDHKYDPIAQEDYYRLKAFFQPYRVRIDRLPGKSETFKGTNAAGTGPEYMLRDGMDRVYDADPHEPTYVLMRGNEKAPIKDRPIAPGVPAFLGGQIKIQPVAVPADLAIPELRAFRQREIFVEPQEKVDEARANLAKAPDELAAGLARRALATREAELASIRARLAAEKARYSVPPSPEAHHLALAAERAQRTTRLRRAEEVREEMAFNVANLKKRLDETVEPHKSRIAAAQKRVVEAEASVQTAQRALGDPPSGSYEPLVKSYPTESTGRRLALARWIASRENPLAARVAVNHIWLRHFGSALVPSVFNFGTSGKGPTHPQLLDWLAVEFMDHGWSMKHIHRLIVTSAAYRMQSAGPADSPAANAKLDRENVYLWRMNSRRMDAEVVRDSMLYLAGALDTTMGGCDLDPTSSSMRRSVYFRHTPDDKIAFLNMFDAPNPIECFRRTETVVPQQALALANGALSLDNARRLAGTLSNVAGTTADGDARFVRLAYEQVLARAPEPQEAEKAIGFLVRQTALLAEPSRLTSFVGDQPTSIAPADSPRQRAREGLVHVLFNTNEFVTVR